MEGETSSSKKTKRPRHHAESREASPNNSGSKKKSRSYHGDKHPTVEMQNLFSSQLFLLRQELRERSAEQFLTTQRLTSKLDRLEEKMDRLLMMQTEGNNHITDPLPATGIGKVAEAVIPGDATEHSDTLTEDLTSPAGVTDDSAEIPVASPAAACIASEESSPANPPPAAATETTTTGASASAAPTAEALVTPLDETASPVTAPVETIPVAPTTTVAATATETPPPKTTTTTTPAASTTPPTRAPNTPDTREAMLLDRPKDLFCLWEEYENGSTDTKPAKLYTAGERGKFKQRYSQRKKFWDTVSTMVRQGLTAKIAIESIYEEYGGRDTSVSKILSGLRQKRNNGKMRDKQRSRDKEDGGHGLLTTGGNTSPVTTATLATTTTTNNTTMANVTVATPPPVANTPATPTMTTAAAAITTFKAATKATVPDDTVALPVKATATTAAAVAAAVAAVATNTTTKETTTTTATTTGTIPGSTKAPPPAPRTANPAAVRTVTGVPIYPTPMVAGHPYPPIYPGAMPGYPAPYPMYPTAMAAHHAAPATMAAIPIAPATEKAPKATANSTTAPGHAKPKATKVAGTMTSATPLPVQGQATKIVTVTTAAPTPHVATAANATTRPTTPLQTSATAMKPVTTINATVPAGTAVTATKPNDTTERGTGTVAASTKATPIEEIPTMEVTTIPALKEVVAATPKAIVTNTNSPTPDTTVSAVTPTGAKRKKATKTVTISPAVTTAIFTPTTGIIATTTVPSPASLNEKATMSVSTTTASAPGTDTQAVMAVNTATIPLNETRPIEASTVETPVGIATKATETIVAAGVDTTPFISKLSATKPGTTTAATRTKSKAKKSTSPTASTASSRAKASTTKAASKRAVPNPVGPTRVLHTEYSTDPRMAVLSERPKDLFFLWDEYEHGTVVTKPAKLFTPVDRTKCEEAYSMRKVFWDKMSTMVHEEGSTPMAAVQSIYAKYGGHQSSVTAILEKMIQERNENTPPDEDEEEDTGSVVAHSPAPVAPHTSTTNTTSVAPTETTESTNNDTSVAVNVRTTETVNAPDEAIQTVEAPQTETMGNETQILATVSERPKDLFFLWDEYENGVNGTKPAKLFNAEERRRSNGAYYRRKVFWDTVTILMEQKGYTAQSAIQSIYDVNGGRKCSVTNVLNGMLKSRATAKNSSKEPSG